MASTKDAFSVRSPLLAELQHPSIVRYIAHGSAVTGQPYLVMEWLEGQTLAARLRKGWLRLDDLVTLAMRIVDGLASAAQRGVIHRDVKPENIFLPAGRIADAKLLDFGLARRVDEADALTRSGVVLGTPLYMSPEQARGLRTLEVSSDVFSLGSVLFECMCGVSPFESDTALATLAKICFEQPPAIGSLRTKVPDALGHLLGTMLQKVAANRPSYAAIGAELRRIDAAGPEAAISIDLLSEELRAGGSDVPSLRPRVQQRVLSAVFAAQTDEYSDERLAQILDVLLDRHGARYERLVDGSIVLLLDRYQALHEQTIAAAHCALALRELLPDSPLVVTTARAVIEGRLPMGSLLENGARLLVETGQGVIRLDEASVSLLEARFELRSVGNRHFLERIRFGGEAPRTLLGRLTPFVGRDRELGQIELLFRECVDEYVTRAVLVTAPAGAGKSRLRFELMQRLRKTGTDFTLLTGAGDALRSGAPFSALAPALTSLAGIVAGDSLATKCTRLNERVASVLPAARAQQVSEYFGEMLGLSFPCAAGSDLEMARSDPQLLAKRMLTSWLNFLSAECQKRPVVIMMDDLHWSDQASLQFLEANLRQSEQPLLLVAFARPEIHDKFPRLWTEREVLALRLPKLNPRACERLLAAIPEAELGLEQRKGLIERADGNPFYLEELIRSGGAGQSGDSLPDSILAAIQARLDALGEDAKLVLRIASVFGAEFRADGVTALLGPQAKRFDLRGWLTVLVERELVFVRGDGDANEYGFRHALVRDAAYALLTESERSLAHRLGGDWLESLGVTEPAVLAEHFESRWGP
ncbi:MAG: protein kinase [Myxococcales bacterium]